MDEMRENMKRIRDIPMFSNLDGGNVKPLSGVVSLNNHVFRVEAGDDSYFVRLASGNENALGIRRAEELAAMEEAASAGIAPPILYSNRSGDFVTPFIPGRHWTAEDFARPGQPRRLGDFLRTLHGAPHGTGTTLVSRLDRMVDHARRAGFSLPDGIDGILETCRIIHRETGGGSQGLNHMDLWPNNFLDDGRRLWAVDWEFSAVGNGLHDFNTLLMASGYTGEPRREFLEASGRDPAWVEACLPRYQYLVHAFEGTWACVQHGIRGSGTHGYADMARSHFKHLSRF